MTTPPATVEELELLLSEPDDALVEMFARLDGDLVLLGAGGKMGPTMARMARRAADQAGQARRIIAVSRFHDAAARGRLEAWNIETIACDLLQSDQVRKLPQAGLVLALTGFKFGAGDQPWLAWGTNAYSPGLICEHYAHSRIVAFSTGNVYGMVPIDSDGSRENDPLLPDGEYAMTAVARERMYEFFSHRDGTEVAVLRLNYATELRYGVLVDLAEQIRDGQPIELKMGYVNVIWLGDANRMALRALEHTQSPPRVLNLAGPEVLRVREVAETLARHIGCPVQFSGSEAPRAFLNDGRAAMKWLGQPSLNARQMIHWTADWVAHHRPSLKKPTHFQQQHGKF